MCTFPTNIIIYTHAHIQNKACYSLLISSSVKTLLRVMNDRFCCYQKLLQYIYTSNRFPRSTRSDSHESLHVEILYQSPSRPPCESEWERERIEREKTRAGWRQNTINLSSSLILFSTTHSFLQKGKFSMALHHSSNVNVSPVIWFYKFLEREGGTGEERER